MAVILKNVDMPLCCGVCPFSKPWDNATCTCEWKPTEPTVSYEQEKPEWCPLEPVN